TSAPAPLAVSGFARYVEGDYQGAVDAYTQAIKLDPKFFEAYRGRARAYLRLRDFSHAYDDATQAINLAANSEDRFASLNLRSKALLRLGRFNEALSDMAGAEKATDRGEVKHSLRGLSAILRQDWPTAEAEFRAAADLVGDKADYLE